MAPREEESLSRSAVIALAGAAAGVVIAIVATAMSAGLVIDGAAGFVVVDQAGGGGRGTLTAGTDAMYLYVLGWGILGGWAVAFVTAATERKLLPDRFSPYPIGAVGSIAAAVSAYVVLRAGIGIGGTITNELITVSVFRGVVIFIVAGAVAGAVAATVAERLSQPATLGLAGEAWPGTAAAFVKESLPAVFIPVLALLLAAGAIIGIAQLLLAGGTTGAIVAASLISAGILGGAALLAYRKGEAPADG